MPASAIRSWMAASSSGVGCGVRRTADQEESRLPGLPQGTERDARTGSGTEKRGTLFCGGKAITGERAGSINADCWELTVRGRHSAIFFCRFNFQRNGLSLSIVYVGAVGRYPMECKEHDRMRLHYERAFWTVTTGAAYKAWVDAGTACGKIRAFLQLYRHGRARLKGTRSCHHC